MSRVLLLIPVASYRAADFLAAADKLAVEVVVASDRDLVLGDLGGAQGVALDFADVPAAVRRIAVMASNAPFDAVVNVDDAGAELAAAIATELGLAQNRPEAARNARDKYLFRQSIAAAGLPGPAFRLISIHDDIARLAGEVAYPCVVKPLTLAMSRGVIRCNDAGEFEAAVPRIARILAREDADTPGRAGDHLLVEDYVPGREYALEGLISRGRLHALAIFDKPDPLEGPFFEETIYVNPAPIDDAGRARIVAGTQAAIEAVGLIDGPVHVDLRVDGDAVVVLELDARSIGGHCGRSLRFPGEMRLEEVILRHATGKGDGAVEALAGGVMMIPIPATGVLRAICGQAAAEAVDGIVGLSFPIPLGQPVETLPEGGRYLGFIIAHGDTAPAVVASLRAAHAALEFEIEA